MRVNVWILPSTNPKDVVIQKVELPDGSTVRDAVRQACRQENRAEDAERFLQGKIISQLVEVAPDHVLHDGEAVLI